MELHAVDLADPSGDPIEIDLTVSCDGWPSEDDLRSRLDAAVAACRAEADLRVAPGAELSVVFADDAAVRDLNRDWRGLDKPTNVLSFPGGDESGPVFGPLLGDIVLALETVKREAMAAEKPFSEHLSHLIVHGVLHLFGYDHQIDEEAEEMEGLETRILARLGIPDPYQQG